MDGGDGIVDETMNRTVHGTAPGRSRPPDPPDPAEVSVEQLYHAHRLGLVRLPVLLVDELGLAEDVVQEAFAGLHTRWSRLRNVNAALGYLRTSVYGPSPCGA